MLSRPARFSVKGLMQIGRESMPPEAYFRTFVALSGSSLVHAAMRRHEPRNNGTVYWNSPSSASISRPIVLVMPFSSFFIGIA